MALEYTLTETITPEQYRNSFVNFYRQVLGMGGTYGDEGGGGGGDTFTPQQTTVSYSSADDDDEGVNIDNLTIKALDSSKIFGLPDLDLDKDPQTDRVNTFEIGDNPTLRDRLIKNSDRLIREGIPAFAGLTGGMTGAAVTAGLTSLVGGSTYLDEADNPQFRPDGFLGVVGDLRRSQRRDKLQSIAAGANQDGDVGFAFQVGTQIIVRGVGDNFYSGPRQGLSHTQMKNIEAVSKGILPETFRFQQREKGTAPFTGGKQINQTINGSGGLLIDPNDPSKGFYRGNGAVYTHRFGYAPVSRMEQVDLLAENYGITRTQALDAIHSARQGNGTVQSNVLKISKVNIAGGAERRDSDKDDSPSRPSVSPSQPSGNQSGAIAAVEAAKRRQQAEASDSGTAEAELTKMLDRDAKREDLEDRYDMMDNAKGGFIGMNVGGLTASKSGFVDGVPPSQTTDAQEVADDKEGKLPEGAYVINASAVTFAGETDIINMLRQAQEEAVRRGIAPENPKASSMIDVAVSRGEVVVAPYLVNIIGKDRLEKINNRGVKDTERKIKENGQQAQAVAKGGFLDMNNGGEVASPFDEHIEIPEETIEAFKKFGKRKRQRGEINKFINSLSDRDAIMLTLLTETYSNITPVEDMEAIAEVIINRRDTDYQDFKTVNTVKEVLQQRVDNNPNKAYQFSGLEPSTLEARLKEVIDGLADEGLKRAFIAASNVTDPEAEGYKRLPYNTLFYTKPGADNQWMRDSDLLEFADQVGPHEFYSAIPMDSKGRLSPEFP